MRGSLLVAGTSSDAGKSTVAAGVCRWLAREGVRVAPFKAQNMSNNSMVTVDGAEIGRAQWVQALAAGVEPEAAMNPVLLKPGSDRTSHVVLMGKPAGTIDAYAFGRPRDELRNTALTAFAGLRERFDVVICEGAGSPAEINLRDHDFVNMGLARSVGLPVVIVADIDRGGVFASLYGTLALLDAADQALVGGFLINKFRGDARLLEPGLDELTRRTARPTLGVVPWTPGLWVDGEDGVDLDGFDPTAGDGRALRIAVVRLPRISNFTDVDALAAEPGVVLRYVTTADDVAAADLAIVPGTRATIADLEWLRDRGIDRALRLRASAARPVLGICGGFQMLGERIIDGVESAVGEADGLGLLPVRTTFRPDKMLGRPTSKAYGQRVTGYEIRHGTSEVTGDADAFPGGCRVRTVIGTSWHGIFECDAFRRAFLSDVAAAAGRPYIPDPSVSFAALRESRLDRLGSLIEEHVDTQSLWRLIDGGIPEPLPVVAPRLTSR